MRVVVTERTLPRIGIPAPCLILMVVAHVGSGKLQRRPDLGVDSAKSARYLFWIYLNARGLHTVQSRG